MTLAFLVYRRINRFSGFSIIIIRCFNRASVWFLGGRDHKTNRKRRLNEVVSVRSTAGVKTSSTKTYYLDNEKSTLWMVSREDDLIGYLLYFYNKETNRLKCSIKTNRVFKTLLYSRYTLISIVQRSYFRRNFYTG